MALRWTEEPDRTETRTKRSLRRVASLRPADVRTLLVTLGWIVAAKALILARGFGGTARLLRLAPARSADRAPGAYPMLPPRTRRALRVAIWLLDRRWIPATCLPRSIVLLRLLARHEVAGELVLGCVTDDGFKAHAWVEVNGYPVGRTEQGATRWTPLARFARRAS